MIRNRSGLQLSIRAELRTSTAQYLSAYDQWCIKFCQASAYLLDVEIGDLWEKLAQGVVERIRIIISRWRFLRDHGQRGVRLDGNEGSNLQIARAYSMAYV